MRVITDIGQIDRETLIEVGQEFLNESRPGSIFSPDAFLSLWDDALLRGVGTLFIDEAMRGFAGILFTNDYLTRELMSHLIFWYVRPAHRKNHKIALDLLHASVGWAKTCGVDRFVVTVPGHLSEFFEGRGFTKLETTLWRNI